MDKTKLPGDTYEAWLKTQKTQPEAKKTEKRATDSYEDWIGKRVESKLQAT